MIATQSSIKPNLLVKQTSILAATILIAVIEKSILPVLFLLPIFRQEKLIRSTANRIASVEQQYALTPNQIATLDSVIEAQKAELNRLNSEIRIQRTRQNLTVAKIQQIYRKNRLLQSKVETAISTSTNPAQIPTVKPYKRGIFVDSANIECAARQLNSKIDYRQLKAALKADYTSVDARIYIGENAASSQQKTFLHCLRKIGYTVVTKPIAWYQGKPKANVDVDLTVDLIKLTNEYESVVLVSGDGDYLKAVRELQSRGIKVAIAAWGFHANKTIIKAADEYIDLANIQDRICRPHHPYKLIA